MLTEAPESTIHLATFEDGRDERAVCRANFGAAKTGAEKSLGGPRAGVKRGSTVGAVDAELKR